jgi:hypothetical protein
MGKNTDSEDEKTKLGPLSRDNHEQWFRYERPVFSIAHPLLCLHPPLG